MDGVIRWLELNGFIRASTVREPGDYAVRGGILDLFAPGMDLPVRLDFFGDTLETDPHLRSRDPAHVMAMRALDLVPVAEFQLTTDTIRQFRTGYVAVFGAAAPDDTLYEAVSEGRRHPGMEHWLPLFHDQLDTLFDYLPGAPLIARAPGRRRRARAARADQGLLRGPQQALMRRGGGAPYKPLPPDRLYLAEAEWRERLDEGGAGAADAVRGARGRGRVVDVGARQGRNFAAERAEPATPTCSMP